MLENELNKINKIDHELLLIHDIKLNELKKDKYEKLENELINYIINEILLLKNIINDNDFIKDYYLRIYHKNGKNYINLENNLNYKSLKEKYILVKKDNYIGYNHYLETYECFNNTIKKIKKEYLRKYYMIKEFNFKNIKKNKSIYYIKNNI